jgi:hypothetical protein
MGLCVLLVGVGVHGGVAAAGDEAWFGVATPEARQAADEARRGSEIVDLDWGSLSLRLAESQDPYQDITGEEMIEHVRDVVAIAEQSRDDGVPLWGRISGGPYERLCAKYLAQKFTDLGLEEVRIEDFARGPQFWPLEWEVTLIGDHAYGEGTEDHTFGLAFPCAGNLEQGDTRLEAELVDVGLGRSTDLFGKDLNGKVAVVHSVMQPSGYSHTAYGVTPRLVEAGAAGFIVVMDVPKAIQFYPAGLFNRQITGFTISGFAGGFLEEVIARAGPDNPPRVRLRLKSETKTGWMAQNVYGLIPGETDEYVVLTAHMDSFFQGANDNGSGIAVMLALAKHYGRPGAPKPRRNMLFIGTAGHHVQTAEGWYSIGVADVIRQHPDILSKTVFVLNCEHIGGQYSYMSSDGLLDTNVEQPMLVAVPNRSPLLLEILHEAVDRYGIVHLTWTHHRPLGDPYPFVFFGVPVVHLIASNTYYHTSGDTVETTSVPGLTRAARAYAYFLDETAKHPRAEMEEGAIDTATRKLGEY